jgi:transcriptional regulator with XRE-family HTH domain
VPPDVTVSQADGRMEEPGWRAWMQDLGRRQRRLREFVGLSQEQVARLAGVSQGAISRLETARGLATPLLIVVKINTVLAHELRRLDPTLLSAELREAVELHGALTASGSALGLGDLQLADDPQLEEIVRLFRETPERHRPGALSVLRAMVAGLKKGVPA